MRILAIDPGSDESAYLVWDGKVECCAKVKNSELLEMIRMGQFHRCGIIAIEMVACYGMPVGREVFDTCVWIGRYLEAASRTATLIPKLVFRREVKIHLCGSMKAKDGNIRQALIDKHGAPGTKKAPGPTYGISGDMWSALAVADFALSETKEGFTQIK